MLSVPAANVFAGLAEEAVKSAPEPTTAAAASRRVRRAPSASRGLAARKRRRDIGTDSSFEVPDGSAHDAPLPATELSPVDPETSSFASPPHDGFAIVSTPVIGNLSNRFSRSDVEGVSDRTVLSDLRAGRPVSATKPRVPARVLIVDDHPLFLEGIGMLVDRLDGVELVGRCDSGEAGIEALASASPGPRRARLPARRHDGAGRPQPHQRGGDRGPRAVRLRPPAGRRCLPGRGGRRVRRDREGRDVRRDRRRDPARGARRDRALPARAGVA